MEDKTLLKEMSATFTAVVKPKLLAFARGGGKKNSRRNERIDFHGKSKRSGITP